jgi:hypothetical protein
MLGGSRVLLNVEDRGSGEDNIEVFVDVESLIE